MKHRSNRIPNRGKQWTPRDREVPPNLKIQIDNSFHVKLGFWKRVSLIFGYNLYIDFRSYFETDPGAWYPVCEARTTAALEPPIAPLQPRRPDTLKTSH